MFQAGVAFSETTTSQAWREALKRLTETHSPTLEEVRVAYTYQVRTGGQPERKLGLAS